MQMWKDEEDEIQFDATLLQKSNYLGRTEAGAALP
jgi:hypothetical protein